eukprot:TRINITY_DN4446_c0_g1_i1.p1 TRINITY_DN4446_c0_g1~~TRINITY_DN4446_c0_g1_i1.p1  ORF type:complete len:267 (+),score=45.52 TRINITY_DN4446_c0_g1_i1:391-1191(+)
MIPFITQVESIQVTVQTDLVENIPCGTSGGVMVYFDKIEVVNKLQRSYVYDAIKNYTSNYDKIWINDRIHHEINQFCSKHTLQEIYIDKFETLDEELQARLQFILKQWLPGLQILAIRITKPRIPPQIKQAFELMEQERNKLIIMKNKRNVKIQETFTASTSDLISAKTELEVSQINIGRNIKEQENKYKLAQIRNQMLLEKETSQTNSTYYASLKELETQEQILTQKYMKSMALNALLSNTSFIIGNKIPQYMNTFDKPQHQVVF